jgi:uncharacterized circularly permuted ATP-grasp superfamily protein
MTPMIKALVAQVSPELAKKIENAESLQAAIGAALTQDQQLAVSAKIATGPEEFIAWSKTDAGRTAIKEFADKFTSA